MHMIAKEKVPIALSFSELLKKTNWMNIIPTTVHISRQILRNTKFLNIVFYTQQKRKHPPNILTYTPISLIALWPLRLKKKLTFNAYVHAQDTLTLEGSF